ncbi:hypothetical protein L3Y34_011023 [Caenorhabditis briggsae]|uniref:Uncharacterized protein n=1 Tax=Caenorhabditis briggsae TaxID=6238 RepID=A0AAE8ZTB0_CAEBR|nr:hypothetical protein L3Y34_011023 [Caenorhabditis briggsae]
MMVTRNKSDSLMDQIFSAVTLPTVGQTIVEEHHEESHTVNHHESHHVESHTEHFEYTSSGVTVGNVVGHQQDRRPTVDFEDQRSEVSALSKATSVSVHSSVSQKSAQHYDLPPIPQYDMPPITVGEAVVGKAPSQASSKSGSRHSVASHHSHHSQHSHHSAVTHDSESTITEGTLVNQPIVVGGAVGGGVVVGGVVGSAAATPLAVGQSLEHDAVIEQFKNLHGRDESVVSSIVPASVHLQSDSEDSIAPSKLTHSIAVGGVVGSQNGIDVLHRSHELDYTDFAAPAYYQAPSVQAPFDTRSEDSFGFEKVEYVENVVHPYQPEVVMEHITEYKPTYEPYEIVHENHKVPSVDFNEEHRHSVSSEHHHHDHDHHHHHHDSHVTHSSDVKQSRSNSASTYQSRQIYAHTVGPKITEEMRPAVVLEEEERVEVRPIMAYVAPIPMKPPRTHEESHHAYDAYESDNVHQYKEIVKSTTVVQEDVRFGSEGVSALRRKFEHGAPPPMSPVLDLKKYEQHQEQHHHRHHHHHHHEDVIVVEQPQVQKVSEHVQLGGSRKSTIQSGHHHHHHHHENHNDVPSRPSSVASSVHHQPHSRTSTVSTVRGAPIQRVQPIQNPYGDHQSVRVVKNVREFVNVFGATHVVPPPTPLAGIPRLPPRSPISHETFQPHCESVKSSRKSSVVSIGNGVQINNAARKSTCSSVTSSRKSSVSSVNGPVIVGGNVVCPAPRSRNATLTQENVHDHYEGEHTDLIHVADMRKLFENYGPAHLPEYASSPYAYIH